MSMVQVTVRNHGRTPRMRAGVVFPGKVKGQPSERTVQVSKARLREITACRFLELVGEGKADAEGEPEPVRKADAEGEPEPVRKADAEGEPEPVREVSVRGRRRKADAEGEAQ